MPSVNPDRRDASRTFVPRAGDERPKRVPGPSSGGTVRRHCGLPPPQFRRPPAAARRACYLAVLVLFCFGFLGVLAFLSMSLLCRAGAARCRRRCYRPPRPRATRRRTVEPAAWSAASREAALAWRWSVSCRSVIDAPHAYYGGSARKSGSITQQVRRIREFARGRSHGRTECVVDRPTERGDAGTALTELGYDALDAYLQGPSAEWRERWARTLAQEGVYRAATPAMAGMTSRPMRSSCSRSSPFIR